MSEKILHFLWMHGHEMAMHSTWFWFNDAKSRRGFSSHRNAYNDKQGTLPQLSVVNHTWAAGRHHITIFCVCFWERLCLRSGCSRQGPFAMSDQQPGMQTACMRSGLWPKVVQGGFLVTVSHWIEKHEDDICWLLSANFGPASELEILFGVKIFSTLKQWTAKKCLFENF